MQCRRPVLLFAVVLSAAAIAAQQPLPDAPQTSGVSEGQKLTMFPHPENQRWFLSGQANIVFQAHPGFHSPYEGVNSLLARGEYKVSLVGTLFSGYQLVRGPRYSTDVLLDLESAGGRGISEALGLAGFTNLDVVRNPQLGPTPYVARAQVHQVIGLTDKTTAQAQTPFSPATQVPERRFDLRVGSMSLPDVLDQNGPASDSHLQFLNWTVDNNGAWDYAADTRGYTYAAVAEYDDVDWSVRYALALMPTVANGTDLDWNLRRARGENVEIEDRKSPFAALLARVGNRSEKGEARPGNMRLLGFVNHAGMGIYRNAVRDYVAGRQATPDITAHPPGTTVKYGIGLNFEQQLAHDVRAFGRFGWNEGQHESYAYTEVDQTFELGADMAGTRWARPADKVGIAAVSNAIKRDHQHYLADGGLGFLLGEGRLNYAREDILETYYTAHNWRGLFTAFDLQLIAHPGYNQDRGPVAVFSVRTHVDF